MKVIVADGQADLVFLTRPVLRSPQFPVHVSRALGQADAVPMPAQYLRRRMW